VSCGTQESDGARHGCSAAQEKGDAATLLGGGGDHCCLPPQPRPTKALDGKIPFEAYHGKKLPVGFFRMFGCLGFVKDKKLALKKLDDRTTLMVFIGYSEGAKAYRMLEPSTGRMHVSHNIVFDESRGWSWTSSIGNGEPATQRDFKVKFYTVCVPNDDIGELAQGGAPPSPPGLGTPQVHMQTPPPADRGSNSVSNSNQ
jgi:hypothetical protein